MSTLSFQTAYELSPGHEIPRLGFGVAFGFGKIEDAAALSVPSTVEALKVGYRHLDTAQAYRNEADVGVALRKSGVKREDVFITSKVIWEKYAEIAAAVDVSLKTIGLDYLDLYLIHSAPPTTEARLQAWKGLLDAKKAGKIRAAGVSNYNVARLEEIKNAGLELPSVNQVELHPLCQQRPVVEYCKANNIHIEAYCPIIRGHMGNPVITSIAKKHARDSAQILLRWSLQTGLIPLVRSSNPARILSNSQLYDFELDATDMQELNALDQGAAGAISWNPVDKE
ncbi:hypothetical protein EIP91_003368 [Steccherinum ochraceum]|uniref:NADP-dependent oxidoreductase domain-containing protein n=1 Tax=Steccherinum ochraceum TaxID=92696 RepID=A0A4R0RAM5_9APHY|nr:hypothetical protein EIP91_003368 [Steccherinum ochraceum]